jgi:hypothetical protein
MEDAPQEAIQEVHMESERPFTLRLSRDNQVTTDTPDWVSISPIGGSVTLVVVSGSPTYGSSVDDIKVFVPVGSKVSVPIGMAGCNLAVEAGLEIIER